MKGTSVEWRKSEQRCLSRWFLAEQRLCLCRRDHFRIVVLYGIHPIADFVALHLVRLRKDGACALSSFDVVEPGIEPEIVILGVKDDRHAIMHIFRELVGRGGDDRTGLDPLAFRILPALPDAGKGEGTFVGHGETERTLLAAGFLPLVETIGRNEAAALAEGLA